MTFPPRLPIPDDVLAIARKLQDAGFEAWCVGGAVRDNLLGFENKDFDLATSARPEDVRRLFRRTVPVGIEHGTVAVLDRRNRLHEVTTFRRDVVTDGRHAIVEFGANLEEDLARRDFTINAIAYQPLTHEWRDPFGGEQDLERKTIRAVGNADQRFKEDYLRILRALRFAARFEFQIERGTWDAARANIDGLRHLSAERVREEWFRGLATAVWPSGLLALWSDAGALDAWLPEVARDAGAPASPGTSGASVHPEGRVDDRMDTGQGDAPGGTSATVEAVDRLPRDPVLITVQLSRDPETTLTRLKCSNAEIERGRRIAEFRESWPDPASGISVRRWLSEVGSRADDLIAIAVAEDWGKPLAESVRRVRESGAPLTIGDLAVRGKDLIALGLAEGPLLGETLRALLDRVLEEPEVNTKERLLDIVRQGAREGGPTARDAGQGLRDLGSRARDVGPTVRDTGSNAPDVGPTGAAPAPPKGETPPTARKNGPEEPHRRGKRR